MPIPTSLPQPGSPPKSLPAPTSKPQTFGPSPGSPVPSGRGVDFTEPQPCGFRDVRLKQGDANIEGNVWASKGYSRKEWADYMAATRP